MPSRRDRAGQLRSWSVIKTQLGRSFDILSPLPPPSLSTSRELPPLFGFSGGRSTPLDSRRPHPFLRPEGAVAFAAAAAAAACTTSQKIRRRLRRLRLARHGAKEAACCIDCIQRLLSTHTQSLDNAMQCETPTVVTAAEHWKFTSARARGKYVREEPCLPCGGGGGRRRRSSSVPASSVAHHRIRFHLKSTAPEIEKSGQVRSPRCDHQGVAKR